VHAHLASRGIPLATAQVQISLLSWGAMQQELVSVADELGMTVFAYSPLCLGLLTGKYEVEKCLPAGPRGALFRQLLPGAAPVLGALQEVAAERGKTTSQVTGCLSSCFLRVLCWQASPACP
jgi:pyridoxine 4-dehydrogenase